MRIRREGRLVAAAGVVGLLAVFGAAGCATYTNQLVRSQAAFDRSEHERAIALLQDLEPNAHRLSAPEQARYAYIRGMSDYQLGHRAEARHWLALARAYEETSPGILPAEWRARTASTIAELDDVLDEGGYEALATNRRPSVSAP